MAKLFFADMGSNPTQQEEVLKSRLAEKMPWIKFSNRAYVTFLNRMRADVFDYMISSAPVRPTPEQIRAIGSAVNIFTGRGEMGRFSGAADFLSIPFWSPRLYTSRLQTILGQPIWNRNAAGVRKVIAREYLRAASFGAGVMLLGALAGASIEYDPDSSDFVKLKFGNVRIDPWGGHQQWLVFLSRILTGEYKTTRGEEVDLSKPKGPLAPDYLTVIGRMTRSKLNPVLGAILDWKQGRDLGGKPVTAKSAAMRALLPLSVYNDDIIPIAKEFGLSGAAASFLLNLSGVGVQHYKSEREKREYHR